MSPIPVIELKGHGLELGRAHGEELRDQIRRFVEVIVDLNVKNIPVPSSREDLLGLCGASLSHIERYSPELLAEMKGIAQGAGVDFQEVLLLNCFLELNDLRAPMLSQKLTSRRSFACTTFNLKKRATKDRAPRLGQTYDMELLFADYTVVLKISTPGRPSRTVFSLAGVLGLNGVNSQGISLVINKLVPTDSRPGVIYPVLVRQALDQVRIGDALAALAFAPRASGLCYQLSGPDGVAFCLETTAARFELLPFQGFIAHANHYLSPALKPLEADWLTHGGSYARLEAADNFLADNFGDLDDEALKSLCRNHINHPRGICAHYYEDEEEHEKMATIAAVVINPQKASMLLCGCFPCRSEFQEISQELTFDPSVDPGLRSSSARSSSSFPSPSPTSSPTSASASTSAPPQSTEPGPGEEDFFAKTFLEARKNKK
ncbi:MAG: C45 family peptidase [Deltaproteobacteria bacterium]|jgi:isopenicillin-N N-acyltransferase-like protein|nr:C45 family peptidase [Deltaproteobacteria bacterium]